MERRAFLNSPWNDDDADDAEIGSVPPNFDPYVEGYAAHTILGMVVFYNDTFGIVPQDTYKIWLSKFRRFLAEF